jgi:hypothetical protein
MATIREQRLAALKMLDDASNLKRRAEELLHSLQERCPHEDVRAIKAFRPPGSVLICWDCGKRLK